MPQSSWVTGPTRTFTVGATAIAANIRVKLVSGLLVVAGDEPSIGVMEARGEISALAAVRLHNAQGTQLMVAGAAIASGAEVFALAGGKVDDVPSMVSHGVALNSTAADDELVEVLPTFQGASSFTPAVVQQALSGPGAVTVTEYYSAVTTTGADALTIADGVKIGQLKKIQLIVDGGDGTLTPATLSGGTTIVFADAGDYAILSWTALGWLAVELGNDADGATAPVLA
jgi:hypothetical protein